MATTVPSPTLDLRNGAQVAAQAIASLPPELSDRSDANPAVVILEAAGYIYDWTVYQINRWPAAVVQKALALVGIKLLPVTPATVQQTFILSAPQPADTVIAAGTQVSTTDGSIVFATSNDLTIAAYAAQAGTISFTAGSATVTGVGTAFVTGSTWVGWQIGIQGVGGSAPARWYTIQSVTNATTLTLTSTAATTASGAFFAGPVQGTTAAQATTSSSSTNVGAGKLVTLVTSPSFVASTINNAAATGGADIETTAAAIERAPSAFAAKGFAVTAGDYAYFARLILGQGGRTAAQANTNVNIIAPGYVTVALLSPSWTAGTPVATLERAAVQRDLAGRTYSGSTTIDVAATIYQPTPAVCIIRKAAFNSLAARAAVAGAINTYLNPNTYPWGRIIEVGDLVAAVENVSQVDHVFSVRGVPAISTQYNAASPATLALVNGSATANTADTTGFVAGRTWVIDTVANAAYLVTSLVVNTSVTFDRVFAGGTVTATRPWFVTDNDDMNGGTASPLWSSLPYSSLSASATSPAASVFVVGSA